MATLAIICPPLAGHVNPMAALARELGSRGHLVTFVGFPDMQSLLPIGLNFISFGKEDQPPGSLQPYLARLSRLNGYWGVRRLMRDLAGFAETACKDLPSVLQRLRPDALIIDQTDTAASLVARALALPFVNVANALPMNPEPGVPPPVLPWAYDPSARGIRRNIGGYRVAALVERPVAQVIRRHAKSFGLGTIRHAHEIWSDRCQITQCVKSLDFPRQQLPGGFHYVGPLRQPEPSLEFDLPADRPLVFCSLGSLQGSRIRTFRRVAQAAADLDLDLLVAHGGLLPESLIGTLPGNPLVRAFVPQQAVLARSSLAVTHCGFNTVVDALSCATPMVALPIAFEQPATGARLARAGVAVVLQRAQTLRRIRRAMEQLLLNDSYRINAAHLATDIAMAGGVRRAADLVEQSCGLCERPAVPTTARRASDDARGDSRSGNR